MPAAPDFAEHNATFCAAAPRPGCGSGAVPNVGYARSHRFTRIRSSRFRHSPRTQRTRIAMRPGSCSRRPHMPLSGSSPVAWCFAVSA